MCHSTPPVIFLYCLLILAEDKYFPVVLYLKIDYNMVNIAIVQMLGV